MIDLINNSSDMKAFVETYLVEETVDLIYDQEKLDKWNNYVQELGLAGQSKVVRDDKSPIQFMNMTPTMINVFSQLCPRRVSVESFDVVPIPLEILDLIALSKREKYFSRIEIWYDDKEKDPACVGIIESWGVDNASGQEIKPSVRFMFKEEAEQYIKDNGLDGHKVYNYSYSNVRQHLIGRWADVKASFKELQQRAKDRFLLSETNEIQKRIKEEQRKLEDVELTAVTMFGI
jgi:hypothetical protein